MPRRVRRRDRRCQSNAGRRRPTPSGAYGALSIGSGGPSPCVRLLKARATDASAAAGRSMRAYGSSRTLAGLNRWPAPDPTGRRRDSRRAARAARPADSRARAVGALRQRHATAVRRAASRRIEQTQCTAVACSENSAKFTPAPSHVAPSGTARRARRACGGFYIVRRCRDCVTDHVMPMLRELRWWADLLDSRFRIPGTQIRFGHRSDPLADSRARRTGDADVHRAAARAGRSGSACRKSCSSAWSSTRCSTR